MSDSAANSKQSSDLLDPSDEVSEVAIIGAGPIGLELAVALRHHGVPYRHFEAGTVGQTIVDYPRQVRFFSSPERISIAGVPFVTSGQEKGTREEYLAYLRSVATQFQLVIENQRRITSLERDSDGFRLIVHRTLGGPHALAPNVVGEVVKARHVVLTFGDMHRSRQLGITGEDLPHVAHRFTEPDTFFDRSLLIVGGRNSAVEAALRCHRAGARVHLSYRRGEFSKTSVKYWLLPDLMNQIRHRRIGFSPGTIPIEITPTEVRLRAIDGNEESVVPGDAVLLLIGYEQDPRLFDQIGVRREGENCQPVIDLNSMETEIPGLFVAGTAVAGTQIDFKLFIENCHPHVERIVRKLTGKSAPFQTGDTSQGSADHPES